MAKKKPVKKKQATPFPMRKKGPGKRVVSSTPKASNSAKKKGSVDDLPQRPKTHRTAESAELVFMAAISDAGLFHVHEEKKDYGTDFQIEALSDKDVTNFRVHVQLKGPDLSLNADGSVSVSGIRRHNLNYLLGPAQAIYVCYHAPTKQLFARYASDVYREYEHRDEFWQSKSSLTVRFTTPFDSAFQRKLHGLTVATGKQLRDGRLDWAAALPDETPKLIRTAVRAVEVPADEVTAARMLVELLNAGHDEEISGSFARFEAVLGDKSEAMVYAYLAEINLGVNGLQSDEKRIRKAIPMLRKSLKRGIIQPGCIHYCIGNAWMALKEIENAKQSFLAALLLLARPELVTESAMCLKNLGTLFELQEDHESAEMYFRQALNADPELSEAHFALAVRKRPADR